MIDVATAAPSCGEEGISREDWSSNSAKTHEAEIRSVNEQVVEANIERRSDEENQSGRLHDPLALQILLHAFEKQVARRARRENSEKALTVDRQLLVLPEKEEDGLDEPP